MINQKKYKFLNDVLVVSAKKSFWASNECKVFPKRIYTKIKFGNSKNILNTLIITLKTFIKCWIYRPKILLLGAVSKIVPFFIIFKKFRLIPPIKLIITTQLYINDTLAQYVDSIIVYSRSQIKLHHPKIKSKYKFFPLPVDIGFNLRIQKSSENYIFSGGGDGRDFKSLIEAVNGIDVNVKIITFSKKSLGYKGKLPKNVEVLWRMPLQKFLELLDRSLFVVVPLKKGLGPHGQTTIVQALCLGKAVISTYNASIEDYIKDQREGLLVKPGDIAGYRKAILKLTFQPEFRKSCENMAIIKSRDLTYQEHTMRLVNLCQKTITS